MCRQAGCARRPDSLLGCLEMTEETLTGSIERVTFHNPDNGFCVLRVAVEGRPELVTVIGTGATVNVGELIQAEGHWMSDHRGLQFKARSLRCLPPHSREGIERFLASGMVKGIGPEYAKRIVQAFGERTLEVIDRSPAFLREVKGIGEKRLALIRQSWNEQKGVRDLMIFLQSHGMGGARAMRIHRTYGDQAIALIRANPYRLAADIWGVGFHTADELARKLGIAPDAPERARAALLHALRELGNDGHVGFPEDAVADKVVELTSIPTLKAREAIEAERQTGAVVRENRFNPPWLYLKPLYLAESNLAQRLASFLRGKSVIPEANQATIASIERHMKIELAPEQREALRQCTIGKTLIITGGPGVGKTTKWNCAPPQAGPPNACRKPPAGMRAPCTACSSSTPTWVSSSATPPTASRATCFWPTRPACSICNWRGTSSARSPNMPRWCWWAMSISSPPSALAGCWPI